MEPHISVVEKKLGRQEADFIVRRDGNRSAMRAGDRLLHRNVASDRVPLVSAPALRAWSGHLVTFWHRPEGRSKPVLLCLS
jgi:hypothetical protein